MGEHSRHAQALLPYCVLPSRHDHTSPGHLLPFCILAPSLTVICTHLAFPVFLWLSNLSDAVFVKLSGD